jgi:hypothetical protein
MDATAAPIPTPAASMPNRAITQEFTIDFPSPIAPERCVISPFSCRPLRGPSLGTGVQNFRTKPESTLRMFSAYTPAVCAQKTTSRGLPFWRAHLPRRLRHECSPLRRSTLPDPGDEHR